MDALSVTKARARLIGLIDEAENAPILITGKRCNAVLVSEKDWNAIQETVCLLSIPGMRESIRAGLDEPVDQCERSPAIRMWIPSE